ncbi:insulin growth factor binding [Echinococcus multilocularis]|uniref:Insulin growth factor binding n=1 Tax=Echinococcus multilocularis TaxID=6211 RepID=A0A068YDL4_ECHMU|nr:insulin growth factor binding [Echinococcus multilocularis]
MLAAKSMVGLLLLVLFDLSSRASNEEEAGETPLDVCASCDESKCPPVTMCPVGEVKDYCGCCSVCGLEQGHRCNTRQELHDMLLGRRRHGYYGACGKNLECQPRTDVDEQSLGEENICVCTKPGRFCASNGETYSACELEAVQAKSFGEVFLISYDDCKSEPKIVAASESQRVPEGNKTTFWCEIKGYPLPTVTWYYFAPGGSYEAILLPGDSDEMSVSLRGAPPGRRIISHLQIRRFDIKYEGIYQCYVENDLGSDRHNITAIYAPPEPRPRDL